jgi:hypothetical protein
MVKVTNFPPEVCGWHKSLTLKDVKRLTGDLSSPQTLIAYLKKSSRCAEKNQSIKESASSCGSIFAAYLRERLQRATDADSFETVAEVSKYLLPAEDKISENPMTNNIWLNDCEKSFRFEQLTETELDEFITQFNDMSENKKRSPAEIANAAQVVLEMMPSLREGFDGEDGHQDFIDVLKANDPVGDEYFRNPCIFDPTKPQPPTAESRSFFSYVFGSKPAVEPEKTPPNNLLRLVRYLESRILCANRSLDVLRGRQSEKDDAAALLEIANRQKRFAENVKDYTDALTLVGITAAQAATRVQVQASLAELAAQVLKHIRIIRQMKRGVRAKIQLVVSRMDTTFNENNP